MNQVLLLLYTIELIVSMCNNNNLKMFDDVDLSDEEKRLRLIIISFWLFELRISALYNTRKNLYV